MSLGIALLARNSAADLPLALDPLLPYADEVAIVLGGISTDNTAAMAKCYTDRVTDYTGPMDENGGLMDFARARQQSFDLLDTDFALVVDTDDRWLEADCLPETVTCAEIGNHDGVLFPQNQNGNWFQQTRLLRRDSGRWGSPVHEHFIYHSDVPKTLSTDMVRIRQDKGEAGRLASVHRNIRIAEHYLNDGRFDAYVLINVSREYTLTGQFDKALETIQRLLDSPTADLTPTNLFQLYYSRGLCQVYTDQFEAGAASAMQALHYGNYGQGWTLLAEAAYQMKVWDLVLMATDRALALGRAVDIMAAPYAHVSSTPYHLKAKALISLGRFNEALAALDLGIALGGEDMKPIKQELCEKLGVIP